jgi:hypothetical protein
MEAMPAMMSFAVLRFDVATSFLFANNEIVTPRHRDGASSNQ